MRYSVFETYGRTSQFVCELPHDLHLPKMQLTPEVVDVFKQMSVGATEAILALWGIAMVNREAAARLIHNGNKKCSMNACRVLASQIGDMTAEQVERLYGDHAKEAASRARFRAEAKGNYAPTADEMAYVKRQAKKHVLAE